jgi:hypothetical protein
MAIDVKPYGNIYRHITEICIKHFGRYTRPWKYDKTKTELNKALSDEYSADKKYPVQLHEAMADTILRWCDEGYKQTDKDDLMKIFQALWKFHKKWLLISETNTASSIMTQMNAEATNDINTMCSGINENFDTRKKYITDLYVVVMSHIADMASDENGGDS